MDQNKTNKYNPQLLLRWPRTSWIFALGWLPLFKSFLRNL